MKPQRNILLSVLFVCVFFAGCTTVNVSDYTGRTPVMVPEDFFNGPLSAHGVVKNRAGKVVRHFNADIRAFWKNETGTLEEDFVFDNGETQRRVWKLIRQEDGSYIGTAGDVVGEAIGQVAGNSMFLEYVLTVPYGDGTINLMMDDRMYLVNPDTIVNESVMYKFGLRVGEIVLVIRKQL